MSGDKFDENDIVNAGTKAQLKRVFNDLMLNDLNKALESEQNTIIEGNSNLEKILNDLKDDLIYLCNTGADLKIKTDKIEDLYTSVEDNKKLIAKTNNNIMASHKDFINPLYIKIVGNGIDDIGISGKIEQLVSIQQEANQFILNTEQTIDKAYTKGQENLSVFRNVMFHKTELIEGLSNEITKKIDNLEKAICQEQKRIAIEIGQKNFLEISRKIEDEMNSTVSVISEKMKTEIDKYEILFAKKISSNQAAFYIIATIQIIVMLVVLLVCLKG